MTPDRENPGGTRETEAHDTGLHAAAHDTAPRDVGATHASPLQRPSGPSKRSIGAIVGSYKSAVSKRINAKRGTPGVSVWQRNYYEHVIRNESTLNRIRQYIADNPARWAEDPENPARQSHKEKKA